MLVLSTFVAVVALVSPAAIAVAEPASLIRAPHAPDVILVGYEAGVQASVRATAMSVIDATASGRVSRDPRSPERLHLRRGMSVEDAIKRLRQLPGVAYAEPDYLLRPADTSNDTYFTNGSLWGMYGDGSSPANAYGSGAAEAWAQGYTGSHSVYVGVLDEGIQFSHPDLAANIWTNPYEIAGDGIDNDNNGYVDDIHGWDFSNDDASIFDGTTSAGYDDHGTHVAGTIGALGGNGQGVAGVNWQVTIIGTKFLGPAGGYVSDAIGALDYLTDLDARHGLNIVASNNSWGGSEFSQALVAAIERAGDAGMLFVAAAGNDTRNNDVTPAYPSNFACTDHADGTPRGYDCVVSVAAITSSGGLASFSDYGATAVDLGAPGSGIYSTVPNSYDSYSGTSMATPHVTGAIALCASIGGLSAADLRAALVNSVAPTASLTTRTASGGRLDVGAMVAQCSPSTEPVSGAPSDLTATVLGARSIQLDWTDGAQNERAYEIERATSSGGVCGAFAPLAQIAPDSTAYRVDGLPPGADYCFRVRATNSFQGGSASDWSNTAQATLPAVPTYTCGSIAYSWVDAAGLGYALEDDAQVRVNLPAGFGFDFYGESATWIDISANGYLGIGTTNGSTGWDNTTLPNPDQPNGIAAAWWDDLNPNGETHVWTQTLGSAPNRVYVVEWRDIRPFTPGSTSGVTFEILLDEASGAITFSYKDVSAGLSNFDRGASATVGVEDQLGSLATQISYNQPVLASGTSYRCASNGVTPADTIAPTAAPPVAALLAPQTLGTTAALHLSWSASSDPSGIAGYELQYKKGTGAWTSVSLPSPTATAVDFGVKPGKKYAFRLRARDSAGNVGTTWAITSGVRVNLVQEGSSNIAYVGKFKLSYLRGASGGKVRQTAIGGRIARLTFKGSSIGFVTTMGPKRGIAQVWLDGTLVDTLDLYSAVLHTRQIFWSAAPGPGAHVLEIRPSGTRNPAATASRVDIDAFLVLIQP